MSQVWIAIAIVAALGAVALVRSLRRVRDEVGPTIEAFADLRAALRPAIAAVRVESAAVHRRLERRGPGTAPHRG